jgi:hypothetical protein
MHSSRVTVPRGPPSVLADLRFISRFESFIRCFPKGPDLVFPRGDTRCRDRLFAVFILISGIAVPPRCVGAHAFLRLK